MKEEEKRKLFLPGLKFWRNRQRFGKSIPAYKPVGLLYSFPLRKRENVRNTWTEAVTDFIHMQKSRLSDERSYLDFRPASQLDLVAEI